MTFSDRLLQFRGLIRLACSDTMHAAQYELEAEAVRQDLMREHSELLRRIEDQHVELRTDYERGVI